MVAERGWQPIHWRRGDLAVIEFSVSYTLKEYLKFVSGHSLIVINEELRTQGKSEVTRVPFHVGIAIKLAAAVSFFFKKLAMPICQFQINNVGIYRTTRDGIYSVAWPEVKEIYEQSHGHLIVGPSGAFPIPFRCLTAVQREELSGFINSWRSA